MTPEQLKASILQLAIQGKLVPQRPDEGTAEELYQQIQKEKKKLAAAGKLKKEKPLPPITEDELPFDIPESWKWVRLQSICSRFSTGPFGTMLHKCDYSVRGIPVVNPTNIIDGSIVTKKVERISEETRDRLAVYKLNVGDIVLARRGNLAKSAAVGKNENGWLCGTGSFMIHPIYVSTQWFCHLYVSQYVQSYLLADSVGTTMNNLNQGLLGKLPIPLPPLAEQQRIVEKIEQMLPLVEQYGEAYTALESLDARFPDGMRKSILQYAIQGKLVPQRPEEGTAEELYQQIQREKKKLIAAGKLKKEKPLPRISEDEIPFDIPESWKWVRLGDVAKLGSGLTPSKQNPEFYVGGTIPWLLTGDLNDGYIETIPNKITEKALSATTIKIKPANSVVVAMYGATIGKLGILRESACMNQACCCIEEYRGMHNLYIFYYLWANRQKLRSSGEGGAQPNISKEKLISQLLPLPPFAEQKRIVEKLQQTIPQIRQTSFTTTASRSTVVDHPHGDLLTSANISQS